MLAGPIKAWWGPPLEGTPEHVRFRAWRDVLDQHLQRAGHLTYRPHEAFKGAWDERAQVVNDAILLAADVVLNLTPAGIPSDGTDWEMQVAAQHGKRVEPAPPPSLDVSLRAAADAVVRLLGVDEAGQRQMGSTYADWLAAQHDAA